MIPLTYLRSSSYNAHEMCPMQFFISYILGWDDPGGLAANKGTVVHKSMEIIARVKQGQQNKTKYITDDILGKINVNETLNIDNILDTCYSFYKEHSPHLKWYPKDHKDTAKWLGIALKHNDGQFHPQNQQIIEAEQKFDIELKEKWAKYDYGNGNTGNIRLKGTIDLITQIDDTSYEIIDYKTGVRKNWATGEQYNYTNLHDNFQLRLYHYACSILFPKIDTFVITIFYIKDGGPFTLIFSKGDICDTLQTIKDKYEYIRNTSTPELHKSWMCRKICNAGKTTFDDTSILPIIQNDIGHITNKGDVMCKCDQVNYCFKYRNMEDVIDNMTKQGFSCNNYKEPGSV